MPYVDAAGNVYFHLMNGFSYDGPFVKIQADGSRRTKFPIPAGRQPFVECKRGLFLPRALFIFSSATSKNTSSSISGQMAQCREHPQ